MQQLRLRLTEALGIPPTSSGREILQVVRDRSQPVDGVDAEAKEFDLGKVFDQLELSVSGNVFIDWYWYDEIDEMRAADVIACFDDIWYPSSDDIDVFDQSMDWVVSITHHGEVLVTRTRSNNGDDGDAG